MDSDIGKSLDNEAKLISAGGQLSFGAAAGLVSGYALRQGGKMIGLVAGTGFMFVQSLAYLGYIEVNWRKVERNYKNILDRNGDGKITSADFKLLFKDTSELLKFSLPSGSGFTSGLAFGLTGSARLMLLAPVSTETVLSKSGTLNLSLLRLHTEGPQVSPLVQCLLTSWMSLRSSESQPLRM